MPSHNGEVSRPTLRDVARLAHVSVSTASLVLNNKPGISERTRRLVWQAAAQLHYSPDERARELRLGRQSHIALAVDPALTQDAGEVSRLFALRLLNSLSEELRIRGLRHVSLQESTAAAAAIVIGNVAWHVEPGTPVVVAGIPGKHPHVAARLEHDHAGYVRDVVDHLRAQSVDHLVLLREPGADNYQHLVTEHLQNSTLRTTVITAQIRPDAARAATRAAVAAGGDAILSLLPFPGAILAGLADEGLRTPDDVIVVVRGEGLLETQTTPQVTSLSMCGHRCAELIAAALDAVLAGERDLDVVLPHELVVRDSSRRFSIV